jgi:hypothetical protein
MAICQFHFRLYLFFRVVFLPLWIRLVVCPSFIHPSLSGAADYSPSFRFIFSTLSGIRSAWDNQGLIITDNFQGGWKMDLYDFSNYIIYLS